MLKLDQIRVSRWGLLSVIAAGVSFAGCLGTWVVRSAHQSEVVFLRTSDLMSRYKGAIQAREAFQKETSAMAEEAKRLDEQLRELANSSKGTDPKDRDRAMQLRSRLEALRQKGAQRDQELMGPVLAEINAGIKKFAQKNGYRIVIGTGNGGVVLHGDEKLDVTDALVAELNK